MRRMPILITLTLIFILLASFLIFHHFTYSWAAFMVSHSGCGTQSSVDTRHIASSTHCSGKILVFSKTGGFRHDSIKDGIEAIGKLATDNNVAVDFTEDAGTFTQENLAQYKAVVFLLTSGEILNTDQQKAFEHYIRSGGGYAGIHSASDTEYDWPWYGRLVGAYFRNHPEIAQATLHITDSSHPSTKALPKEWRRTDEWYNFRTNPRNSVHVLLTVDETTYKGGNMGSDHPIAWYHEFEGGRSWYSALGHTSESFHERFFLSHLWGGIVYAAGLEPSS